MSKILEIRWAEVKEWINAKLIANGFDLSKEISEHAKWADEGLTTVYTQEDDAELTQESKIQKALIDRPSYLHTKGDN